MHYYTNPIFKNGTAAVRSDTATGVTTEESWFDFWWARQIFLLQSVQMGYGDQSASYPLGTGGSSPVGKATGEDLHLHLQQSLSTSKATPAIHPHSFMAFTEANSPLLQIKLPFALCDMGLLTPRYVNDN